MMTWGEHDVLGPLRVDGEKADVLSLSSGVECDAGRVEFHIDDIEAEPGRSPAPGRPTR